MKTHSCERGAALLLVIVLGTALLGVVGLALDGGNMYVTKQRAQAAADAAAQAGVMDLYRGNGRTNATASATAYAVKDGFASTEVETTYPDCSSLAWCDGHVSLSGVDTPNLIQVTITKAVNSIFLRAVGVNSSTIKASATAAITVEPQPVPILVLHPTAPASFSKNGTNTIQICGGPARSIQVNSNSASSINIAGASGTVDLSHAGPLDTLGDCTTGTGADFGNVGSQDPYPGTLLLGTKPGQYVPLASSIEDPLLTVPAPAKPATLGARVTVCGPPSTVPTPLFGRCPSATHNCPPGLGSNDTCFVYSPGYYPNGILVKGSEFAQFRAGIYWIYQGGFKLQSNSVARMAQGTDAPDPVTGTGWSGQMLVYNSPPSIGAAPNNDIFSIDSNAGKWNGNPAFPTPDCPDGGNCLVGALSSAIYQSILFFQDRTTAATLNHSLSGGGGLTVKGTIYLTHTAARIRADGFYQPLSLQGNAGGVTKVQGEIIVDELSLGGGSTVTMNLLSAATFPVRQVALVR